ncbi:MAG TPA: hypothetical protein VMR41_06320 [Patescibacteria group bacterium]|nr:hypothetical protein [Patescibacteria group bacterium]
MKIKYIKLFNRQVVACSSGVYWWSRVTKGQGKVLKFLFAKYLVKGRVGNVEPYYYFKFK